VEQCTSPEQARCPLCDDPLVAKWCEEGGRVNHWAHYPAKHGEQARTCPHFESEWHVKMKLAALALGWEIEVPIKLNGLKYIVDAVQPGVRAWEFVHTLDEYAVRKHSLLKEKRPHNVTWIYDGEMFVSARARGYMCTTTAGDRRTVYRRLLKPRALGMYVTTRGLIHYKDVLYYTDRQMLDRRSARWADWIKGGDPEHYELLKVAAELDFTRPADAPEAVRDKVEEIAIKKLVSNL